MGKIGRKKSISVRLNRNGKVLNFNAGASEQLEGYADVEVFEKENVVAVRGAFQRGYHISSEVGRPRKALSNTKLVSRLKEKFQCTEGGVLPAWTGIQENVLFFGGIQPENAKDYVLDDSYTPVEVEYNRREGDWAYVHDNWIEFTQEVRENLPPRMSAYRCGQGVVLVGDAMGELTLIAKRQRGNQMLVSNALAGQLRALYSGNEHGIRLRAAILANGVALADSLEALAAMNFTKMSRLELDESKKCFLTSGSMGTMYLSASALNRLKQTQLWEVCGNGPYLALRAARRKTQKGALRIVTCGYAHYVYSRRLSAMMQERWANEKRLHLLRHGDIWLLWPNTDKPANLPPAADFRRIDLSPKSRKTTKTKAQPTETQTVAERRPVADPRPAQRGKATMVQRDGWEAK